MMTNQSTLARCCPELADRLVDLSDGELPAAEQAAVLAHLDGCESCRRQLARLNASLAVLQTAIVEPASANIRSRRRTSGTALWIVAGSTAAAILLAVGIASLFQPPPIVPVDNGNPNPVVALSTDDALRRIALLEQQARLETSLAHLPSDPWFADRRAANERLLSTYREAAAAIDHAPNSTSDSKETL